MFLGFFANVAYLAYTGDTGVAKGVLVGVNFACFITSGIILVSVRD